MLRSVLEETLAVVARPRIAPAVRSADPLFSLVTREFRDAVAAIVRDNETYKVEGSVGRGNWAETAWVSVFDLNITDSATRGVYLVYLIREDGERIYLSLNQGTTSVRRRFGHRYREMLQDYARDYADHLPHNQLTDLVQGRIALGEGRTALTPGYEAGNIAAIAYDRGAIPDDDVLATDLRRMLALYSVLAEIELRGHEQEDAPDAPDLLLVSTHEPLTLEERRQFGWHRRAEGRNRRASRDAKSYHGYRCWVCDVDYVERYGSIARRCVDAHHLVPFAALDERPQRVDPVKDFAIVCATCHRLLHAETPPLTIDAARKLVAA